MGSVNETNRHVYIKIAARVSSPEITLYIVLVWPTGGDETLRLSRPSDDETLRLGLVMTKVDGFMSSRVEISLYTVTCSHDLS